MNDEIKKAEIKIGKKGKKVRDEDCHDSTR